MKKLALILVSVLTFYSQGGVSFPFVPVCAAETPSVESIEELSERIEALEPYVEENPEDTQKKRELALLIGKRGLLYSKQGASEAACEDLQQAADMLPPQDSTTKLLVTSYYIAHSEMVATEFPEQAISDLNSAEKSLPSNAHVELKSIIYRQRVVLCADAKKHDEIIHDAQWLVQMYPHDLSYKALLAAGYLLRGAQIAKSVDRNQAIPDFERAVAICPKTQQYQELLETAEKALGQARGTSGKTQRGGEEK